MKFASTMGIAALASLAICAPSKLFKRDVGNILTITSCLPLFLVNGAWGPECREAVAVPGLIPHMNINHLMIDLTTADPWSPLSSSNGISISFLKIPGISLPLASGRVHITIADNDIDIAHLDADLPANMISGAIVTSYPPTPMTVPTESREAYSSLMANVVGLEAKSFTLKGTVDITFNLGFLLGERTISGVGFDILHVFKGLNGMPNVEFISLTDNTVDTVNKKQTVSFMINIKSLSNVSLKLGDFIMKAAGPAGPVGMLTLKSKTVEPGDNTVHAVLVVDLRLSSAVDFMRSLDTADRTLDFKGFAGSTSNIAMAAANEAFSFSLMIPRKFGDVA